MTTIGFDLDMTLIDSRPGIKAVYEQLVVESGAPIDTDLVISRLGPPVEWELAHWVPEDEVFRSLQHPRHRHPDWTLRRGTAARIRWHDHCRKLDQFPRMAQLFAEKLRCDGVNSPVFAN